VNKAISAESTAGGISSLAQIRLGALRASVNAEFSGRLPGFLRERSHSAMPAWMANQGLTLLST
jgi:hypothetical protein